MKKLGREWDREEEEKTQNKQWMKRVFGFCTEKKMGLDNNTFYRYSLIPAILYRVLCGELTDRKKEK